MYFFKFKSEKKYFTEKFYLNFSESPSVAKMISIKLCIRFYYLMTFLLKEIFLRFFIYFWTFWAVSHFKESFWWVALSSKNDQHKILSLKSLKITRPRNWLFQIFYPLSSKWFISGNCNQILLWMVLKSCQIDKVIFLILFNWF